MTNETPAVHYDAVMKAQGSLIMCLVHEASYLAIKGGNAKEKFERVIDIAESLSKAITPLVPCKDGCSHCCYMAVAISEYEAEAISRYTGKPLASRPSILEFLRDEPDRVKGFATDPCPFLQEGKCSIYPVRPIACRTHHTLGADNKHCVITKDLEGMATTPSLNLMAISGAAVTIAMNELKVGFGDIRDYFPNAHV